MKNTLKQIGCIINRASEIREDSFDKKEACKYKNSPFINFYKKSIDDSVYQALTELHIDKDSITLLFSPISTLLKIACIDEQQK